MRLSQIKLAGFKSFVDPTHIALPGQIVGVVGPNGCGKSNVIDALRWVLGESKASALRGETMQDVIFNGSSKRKPVSRASVELIFDNSLGKAAGQWSSYAEISIKRVLQRDGDSSYHINNQHVRRKDITDIFLGTGLGARAYAIIEQGMISRIIEAKPEELRIFLEEAAGVSKYRDRRRETELRIGDTRDNLLRVSDILQELEKQLVHLGAQAEVAKQYRALETQRDTTQRLFWLVKKQEAEAQRAKSAQAIERTRTELEAETARLRDIESQLVAKPLYLTVSMSVAGREVRVIFGFGIVSGGSRPLGNDRLDALGIGHVHEPVQNLAAPVGPYPVKTLVGFIRTPFHELKTSLVFIDFDAQLFLQATVNSTDHATTPAIRNMFVDLDDFGSRLSSRKRRCLTGCAGPNHHDISMGNLLNFFRRNGCLRYDESPFVFQ